MPRATTTERFESAASKHVNSLPRTLHLLTAWPRGATLAHESNTHSITLQLPRLRTPRGENS